LGSFSPRLIGRGIVAFILLLGLLSGSCLTLFGFLERLFPGRIPHPTAFAFHSLIIRVRAWQLRQAVFTRTVRDLHYRAFLIKQELGEEALNAIRSRFDAWIVFTENEAEASLVFAKGLAYLGLNATTVNVSPNRVGLRMYQWYLASPEPRRAPSFIFYAGHVSEGNIFIGPNVPAGRALVPLTALATGDIHTWDLILQVLLPPPRAGLALRDYFELAASLVDVPPDNLEDRTSSRIDVG
jgi:hypothetical protein